MNKIVIELCADDRQRIDELIAFAGLIAGELKRRPVVGLDLAQGPDFTAPLQTEEVYVGHPVEGAAHLEPVIIEAPDSAPAPISLGEFQKVIVTRCAESADTKEKVQALIHQYADSVSAVPEAKRAEVLAALKEI